MSWRPKDWPKILQDTVDKTDYPTGMPTFNWGLEIGADAMVDALKEKGIYTYGNHTPDIDLSDAPEASGYWCFIPDEEDNGK